VLKISELQAILTKASNLLEDAPIILKAVEGDAESFIHDVQVTISAASGDDAGVVTVNHTTTAPAEPTAETAPADPAPAA
jgi:hypothetical protein